MKLTPHKSPAARKTCGSRGEFGGGYGSDVQENWQYEYDPIGNTKAANSGGGHEEALDSISWSMRGKVRFMRKLYDQPHLEFTYDAMGNRVKKVARYHFSSAPNDMKEERFWDIWYYVRDAQGNIMAVYTKRDSAVGTDYYKRKFILDHEVIYGSEQLGVQQGNGMITDSMYFHVEPPSTPVSGPYVIDSLFQASTPVPYNGDGHYNRYVTRKHYQITDHLGNVNAVISDARTSAFIDTTGGYPFAYSPEIINMLEYYPFGMVMPGRNYTSDDYRYGFNGKEKDDEVRGANNSLDFGARMYDPRLGRWMSVDPLQQKYVGWSPYNFTLDNPILYKDPDGMDVVVTNLTDNNHKAALKNLVSTEVGRKFVAQFARKGDVIGGVKFNETGSRANDILQFNSQASESMGRRAGLTRTFVKEDDGSFGSQVRNASIDDLGKSVIHNVDLKSGMAEEEATTAIGHESLVHVNEDVKRI